MSKHKSFQNKRNFNAWSTESFIKGIPALFYKLKALKKAHKKDDAIQKFMDFCKERNITKTIDGVLLNKTNIAICMKGIKVD